MTTSAGSSALVQVVTLLGAAVVAVPLFKRIGLGSVLGYLAAGLAIGPFGLRLVSDPATILHVAELGVVMFLFVVGLEMKPSHLWSLRGQIFGLGSAQVLTCGALLTCVGIAFGFGLHRRRTGRHPHRRDCEGRFSARRPRAARLGRRDAERLMLEIASGLFAGRDLLFRNTERAVADRRVIASGRTSPR